MSATILVIEGDATAQRLLRETLEQANYNVLIASDGAEGLRLLAAESPALVLLAVTLPTSSGYEIVTRIRHDEGHDSHVPVIMLTAERDVEQKIRSLRAGADDYLASPTDPTFYAAELLARIRSLVAHFADEEPPSPTGPLGQVIAIYGAKGGVGTTTIAINTGIALRRELGRSVCLVDANLQFGDHRVFLDLRQDLMSIGDVATAADVDSDVVRRVLIKHESGVELLLAPPSPETADLVRPEHIAAVLTILRTMFDYIIVDLNTHLDDTTLGIIETADVVYLVITADLVCLKNVRLVLQALGRLGYESSKFKLVLNRSTAVTGITAKNAEGALGRPIDHRIVNDYRNALSALNSGAPFQVSKSDSALGRSVFELAHAIDHDRAGGEPAPAAAVRVGARAARRA